MNTACEYHRALRPALVLGASKLQLSLIKSVQDAGYQAIVLDMNENAPGAQIADKFFKISTLDIDGVRKVVAETHPVLLITAATDMPMRIVAQVAHEFGLCCISPRTAIRVTDKSKMMECLATAKVPLPRFQTATNPEEAEDAYRIISQNGTLPCVVKPVDSSGSRGVILVDSQSELKSAFAYALYQSRKGQVVISEYMQGPEVSVEVFVDREGPKVITITDKLNSGYPHFVELGHCQPSCLALPIQEAIKEVAIQAVDALGIDQGPAHVEIIVCNEQEPKIVEVAARLGGDYISSHLVPLSTGIDLLWYTVRAASGISEVIPEGNVRAAAIRYLTAPPGKVIRIDVDQHCVNSKQVKLFDIDVKVGDEIKEIHDSSDRLGQVICVDETPGAALELCDRVLASVNVVTQ